MQAEEAMRKTQRRPRRGDAPEVAMGGAWGPDNFDTTSEETFDEEDKPRGGRRRRALYGAVICF